MSIERPAPDYDLDDVRVVSSPSELRAMAHPLRSTILDLLLERAATVRELAAAVGKPPSTIAYHVDVLVDADMVRIVRTRKVRAVDERFYGRTARIFYVGALGARDGEPASSSVNDLAAAAAESTPALESDDMRTIRRHARIPAAAAQEFWARVMELANDFAATPRAGDVVFGFVAGLYPTDHPTLPEPKP